MAEQRSPAPNVGKIVRDQSLFCRCKRTGDRLRHQRFENAYSRLEFRMGVLKLFEILDGCLSFFQFFCIPHQPTGSAFSTMISELNTEPVPSPVNA